MSNWAQILRPWHSISTRCRTICGMRNIPCSSFNQGPHNLASYWAADNTIFWSISVSKFLVKVFCHLNRANNVNVKLFLLRGCQASCNVTLLEESLRGVYKYSETGCLQYRRQQLTVHNTRWYINTPARQARVVIVILVSEHYELEDMLGHGFDIDGSTSEEPLAQSKNFCKVKDLLLKDISGKDVLAA